MTTTNTAEGYETLTQHADCDGVHFQCCKCSDGLHFSPHATIGEIDKALDGHACKPTALKLAPGFGLAGRMALIVCSLSLLAGCATARRVAVHLKPSPCVSEAVFQDFACRKAGFCDGQAVLIPPVHDNLFGDGFYLASSSAANAKRVPVDWEYEWRKLCYK